ncbi:aminotransferase class I/II-fold pyridoxal phosphate-dependent enzyme, partial [Sinorhizobium meliloti]
MNNGLDPFERASLIVAHDESNAFDAVVPPIVQTSLFTFKDYDEMVASYRGERVRPIYTRGLNPTVRHFEEMLAKLEGAEDAIGFASGMSAISSTVLSFVEPGDRIVAVKHVYPDAFRLFGTHLKRMRVEVTYVDGRDEEAVAKALPGAKLFYMESPTSWVMDTHDVAALAALARRQGIVTVIDNSWASPVFQQPVSLGVDLVIHSASKYLGGHSDVVAGVVAGSGELIGRIRSEAYPYLGGKLSPFDAWLLIRGMRTLPVRMKAHERSALAVARRLAEHPLVETVCHPGLGNHLPPGLSGT